MAPALLALTIAALGAAVVVRLVKQRRGRQRSGGDIDREQNSAAAGHLPTLRRDPATGVYRPSS